MALKDHHIFFRVKDRSLFFILFGGGRGAPLVHLGPSSLGIPGRSQTGALKQKLIVVYYTYLQYNDL